MRAPIYIFLSLFAMPLYAGHMTPVGIAQTFLTPQTTELKVIKRSDKHIQALQKDFAELRASMRDMQPVLESLAIEISTLERTMKRTYGKRQEFFNKKLSLLRQEYQTVAELADVQEQILADFEIQIKTAQDYAADEDFNRLKVRAKAYYDFDDIQQLSAQVVDIKTKLAQAEKDKQATIDDINKRKKSLLLLQEEYKEKKKQQESFTAIMTTDQEKFDQDISPSQYGELIDAEVRLAQLKKELAERKLAEAERRLSFIEDIIVMYRAQFAFLRKEYGRIQRAARVSTSYVKQMEEQLEAKRQFFVNKSDQLHDKIRIITATDIEFKQKIEEFSGKFNINATDLAAFRALQKEPKTIEEWRSFSMLLNLITEASLLDVEREYVLTQMELEKAQFHQEELEVAIVRSWHKMTSDEFGFNTDEEVEQEIKIYVLNKAELEAQIVALTNARDAAINSLQSLNANLDKIKSLSKLLYSHRGAIFKDQYQLYDQTAKLMNDAEDKMRKRLNWVAKLIEAYSTTMITVQQSIKKVDGVIDELRAKSFWRRSDQSIQWHKLSHFFPDLGRFARDMRWSMFRLFSLERLTQFINVVIGLHDPLKLVLIIVNLIMIIIIFFLLRLYLPDMINYIQLGGQGYPLIRYICLITALILSFVLHYIVSVYAWLVIVTLIRMGTIRDPFIAQIFYLGSIPYLIYLAHHFFIYAKKMSRHRNFQMMSEQYRERFFWIAPQVAYAVIVLACFREAFLLGKYHGSQVPTVLLAFMFIIGQMALISLLGRAQILGALRSDTPLWQWIRAHVSQYYYLVWIIVIGIIMMSNPYVGYGRQVLYVISRLGLTLALIPLFSWLHNRIKRTSLDLFFYYTETDEIKERFVTGRFWYGFFVISSLILFLIVGIYAAARFWNTGVSARDMASWLHWPFYKFWNEANQEVSVTASSLLQIVFFVLGGIALATVINRFVLKRALDPFLVEPGIQNTILTIIRYVILIIAIFMGLSSAGLEGLTTKLAILIAGIGFAAQEAVRDFFSYFVLLVQRPVKIGDLIEIIDGSRDKDNALMGVVRHITPRSIMIRRRNSVTVIVPNSRVVMNPVINWTYSRSFTAFDDMHVTVPFSTDPEMVRGLILEVMDKNPNILKSPAPVVRLDEFLDHGYKFVIRGYLTSDKVLDQWDIASDFRIELVKQLRARGIELASPVRTLRVVPQDAHTLAPVVKPEQK